VAAGQLDLGGRVAVVTGAAQGIGRAVALRLAEEGARLVLLEVADARETAAAIESGGGEVWEHRTDLSDVGSITAAFRELDGRWGPPAALVSVAGVFAGLPFLETPPEVYARVMAVNARGVFFCSQEAARRRAAAASSAFSPPPRRRALRWSRPTAPRRAPRCSSPGRLRSSLHGTVSRSTASAPGRFARQWVASTSATVPSLRRSPRARRSGASAEPEDIADAVAFLATRASWMTGQVLYQAMVAELPPGAVFSAFSIGRMHLPFVAMAALLGGNVRVGLEDNLYLSAGTPARNDQLVERAVRILEAMNVRVLGPEEVREKLDLRRGG
jgi:NAD(P)-dependent dehydrogenase (short-subunit alcohol dehydrogenase family)